MRSADSDGGVRAQFPLYSRSLEQLVACWSIYFYPAKDCFELLEPLERFLGDFLGLVDLDLRLVGTAQTNPHKNIFL